MSLNPGASTHAWQVAHVDGGSTFGLVVCRSASLCLATDDHGSIIVGTSTPTPQQAAAAIASRLRPRGRSAAPNQILRDGWYRYTIAPPAPGHLEIEWMTANGRTVLATSGRVSVRKPTSVTVKLTARGRQLIERKRRLRVIAKAIFRMNATSARTASVTFELQ
jgi:hypothetical protein